MGQKGFSMRYLSSYSLTLFITSGLSSYLLPSGVLAQSSSERGATQNNLDYVTTATRSAQSLEETGSTITSIPGTEIRKKSLTSIKDIIENVPGLHISESGGKGGTSVVRIRGADSRHTLVLIDGIRITDSSTTGGEFDFSNISPTDIDRIEVLRGPQSALYGSDAMGGVINIITKKGAGTPRITLDMEGGSYNTKTARASISGSHEKFSYALSMNGSQTKGFSRWGYRIKRIEDTLTHKLEDDGATNFGLSGRFGIDLSDRTRIDFGGYLNGINADIDGSFGVDPDVPSTSTSRLYNGYVRLTDESVDKKWKNSITLFGNTTDRKLKEYYVSSLKPPVFSLDRYDFTGQRYGLEYQSDFSLGRLGTLIFGAKYERERMETSSFPIIDPFGFNEPDSSDAEQDTYSLFTTYQFSPVDNLDMSVSARIDDVRDVDTFATWRATAAYNIPSTGTTLRTSIGTGAKAPSLYQFYSPLAGNPELSAEKSIGFDAGIDQILFNGKGKLSATFFHNTFKDMIDYNFNVSSCPPSAQGGWGCYINVNRAETFGLEFSGDVEIAPEWVRLHASYTWMSAKDKDTDLRLAHRPKHEGRVGLAITPDMKWSIEPSLTYVGERFSGAGETQHLKAYTRFDMRVEYKAHKNFTLFVRGENLTDKRYEDIYDYGTAGRSVYGGIRMTW